MPLGASVPVVAPSGMVLGDVIRVTVDVLSSAGSDCVDVGLVDDGVKVLVSVSAKEVEVVDWLAVLLGVGSIVLLAEDFWSVLADSVSPVSVVSDTVVRGELVAVSAVAVLEPSVLVTEV